MLAGFPPKFIYKQLSSLFHQLELSSRCHLRRNNLNTSLTHPHARLLGLCSSEVTPPFFCARSSLYHYVYIARILLLHSIKLGSKILPLCPRKILRMSNEQQHDVVCEVGLVEVCVQMQATHVEAVLYMLHWLTIVPSLANLLAVSFNTTLIFIFTLWHSFQTDHSNSFGFCPHQGSVYAVLNSPKVYHWL
jgi:hypothetical protein